MIPADRRLWLDAQAARYLIAIEAEDFDLQGDLWHLAAHDPELEEAFHAVHAGLGEDAAEKTATAITDAVAKHLPSAEIVRPTAGPVTVGMVADELFRHPPGGVSTDGWRLNDELRRSTEPLPRELGLTSLTRWAEAHFGVAPREFWRAFREAALKLELRAAAETEYQLAARSTRKPGGSP